MTNIVWQVADRPLNAVELWEWPMGMYVGQLKKHAAYIISKEQCSERGLNNGPILPLHLVLLKYNVQRPDWSAFEGRRMLLKDRSFSRIEAAMAFAQLFLEQHKGWQPLIV